MKNIWSDIIKSAIVGNVLHLILSLLFTFGEVQSEFLLYSMLTLLLIMWLAIGFRFGYKMKSKSEKHLMILGLISLLPIILFLITCQSLEGLKTLNDLQNYSLFYFLGTPVLLWHKPFIPIMSLFKDSNIYIQLDINAVVVFFVIVIGGYIGFYIKRSVLKKTKNNYK